MGLKKTAFKGLTYEYRKNEHYDSIRLRVWNQKLGRDEPISARVDSDLAILCDQMRTNKLREEDVEGDASFQKNLNALIHKYADRHGLAEYKIRVKMEFATKAFNFDKILELFIEEKKESASNAYIYQHYLKNIWLPFFIERGCTHPSQWKNYKSEAKAHVKTVKKMDGKGKYDKDTWVSIAMTLNGFLEWMHQEGHLPNRDDVFSIHVAPTKEQLKRSGESNKRRDRSVYTFDDIYLMKKTADSLFKGKDELEWKIRAYAMIFGICTGLRRGNLLGLRARNLHPDASIPHFEVEDNVVSGHSRLEVGVLVHKYATKTTVGEVIALPMLQPDSKTLREIARFLKEQFRPDERILNCNPRTVQRWWYQVIDRMNRQCGAKLKRIHPHGWKHSFATNGALNFSEMYGGDLMKFHRCCLHEDVRTTMDYLDIKNKNFLAGFKSLT